VPARVTDSAISAFQPLSKHLCMKPASTISLTIDGQHALVREGATLLDAARSLGIVIPTLCHIPLLPAQPVCRVCLVHVEHDGAVGLKTACSTAAEEGMVATIPLVATKGRASYLGERSAGHQDPGATSAHLLLRTAADTWNG